MISKVPLRWRLALWSSLASAAALLVFAVFTSIILYVGLQKEEDEEVAVAAENLLREYVACRSEGRSFSPSLVDSWINYVILDKQGNILYRSRTMDEGMAHLVVGSTGPTTRKYRRIDWRINSHDLAGVTIVSCYDLSLVKDNIVSLVKAYIVSIPLVMIVVAVGASLLSRRTLAPLRSLADLAETMHADGLHRRMPLPAANDEMRRLATTLNDLFARLEASFLQASRFSADASHELRTPLTVLRGQIESLIRKTDDPQALETGLITLQEEVARLERTIEHLLQLARFDSGQRPEMTPTVDFSALVSETCEDAELLASSHRISLAMQIEPEVTLCGNALLLRQLLLNLLENATHYNDRDGRIECSLSRTDREVTLKIGNTGPGIDPSHTTRLFTRFYRCDPSRSDRRGQGLGLSLSREIARAHGGDLVLSPPSRPGWTEFVLTLPLEQI